MCQFIFWDKLVVNTRFVVCIIIACRGSVLFAQHSFQPQPTGDLSHEYENEGKDCSGALRTEGQRVAVFHWKLIFEFVCTLLIVGIRKMMNKRKLRKKKIIRELNLVLFVVLRKRGGGEENSKDELKKERKKEEKIRGRK